MPTGACRGAECGQIAPDELDARRQRVDRIGLRVGVEDADRPGLPERGLGSVQEMGVAAHGVEDPAPLAVRGVAGALEVLEACLVRDRSEPPHRRELANLVQPLAR